MKKLLCLLLTTALLCALPGCQSSRPPDGDEDLSLQIGVCTYDQYDTFISLLMERFHHYAREKELETGMTITISQEGAGGSQVAQNTQVENFIKAGCDILCVNLVDRTDASFIIDKAEAAGIPVLFFNRELVEEDLERCDDLYYVGAEAKASGQLQGQLAARLLADHMDEVDKNGDGTLQYVMLEGEAGHQDAIFRTEYSISTLTAAGYEVQRLASEIAGWSRARAETKMTQWMDQYGIFPALVDEGCIELVFANNDDMALGAIDALEKANLSQTNWPLIIGIDGTREGLAAVKNGKMAGTVLNNADGQGRALLELAVSLRAQTPLPEEMTLEDGRYVRLPYLPVTPGNVDEYIALYS
ncbi:MAG: galactose ABC transporter substrate-binding protein [Oscillospiraceae bacterium]